jgi:PKD repeat protein
MNRRRPTSGRSQERPRRRSRGQSLVEFALILPVLLVVLLGAIDFGRVFLGWVNLNNTARIASNFAATNVQRLSLPTTNPAYQAAFDTYYAMIQKDATANNCTLPPKASFPAPTYPGGTALGDPAHVVITCNFGLITPIISNILGSPLAVTASSDFPVRTGVIAGTPGGGGGTTVAALFTASPSSGTAPLTVTFTNASTGSPTSFQWDFNGDGTVDSTNASGNTFTYTIPGVYQASLTVSNGLSTDTFQQNITVVAPPGPVVSFTATPPSGTAPLSVTFSNSSTGSGTLTYAWQFGDGTTSTLQSPPPKSYPAGTYTITLTVTDGFGQSNSGTATVTVSSPQCTVPDFRGRDSTGSIQADWKKAGFDTTVIFNPLSPPKYTIVSQTPSAGTQQPCSGTILTVKNS